VYFQVRGSNIHEIVIFDVIFRILEALIGHWASAFVAGRVPWSLGECVFF